MSESPIGEVGLGLSNTQFVAKALWVGHNKGPVLVEWSEVGLLS